MPLDTLLARHARYRPHHTAVVFEAERITFAELDRRVNRIANALLALGLGKGDKIATVLENSAEVIERLAGHGRPGRADHPPPARPWRLRSSTAATIKLVPAPTARNPLCSSQTAATGLGYGVPSAPSTGRNSLLSSRIRAGATIVSWAPG
jgi:non-ribosomal peptide synthetase component F